MRGASLRQLRAFAAVARHRSFVRAAAELSLTPSAVSLQIKELEQSVGFGLFSRGNRGVLTRAGELLLADVNRALLALKDAEDTVNQLQGSETGAVSIGFLTNAAYFMPRILAQYHADHPGVELRISVGNREQLTQRLGNREIDLCIMGAPPGGFKTHAAPLATQPFGIVASSHDPLASERQIPVAALAERVFLVRESGSGTRAAMERFLKDAQVPTVPLMEISSNEAIKQSVIAQLGLAFLSYHTIGAELQTGQMVALDVVGLPLVKLWNVVHLSDEPLSDSGDSLRRFIIDFGAPMIAKLFKGTPGVTEAARSPGLTAV